MGQKSSAEDVLRVLAWVFLGLSCIGGVVIANSALAAGLAGLFMGAIGTAYLLTVAHIARMLKTAETIQLGKLYEATRAREEQEQKEWLRSQAKQNPLHKT